MDRFSLDPNPPLSPPTSPITRPSAVITPNNWIITEKRERERIKISRETRERVPAPIKIVPLNAITKTSPPFQRKRKMAVD